MENMANRWWTFAMNVIMQILKKNDLWENDTLQGRKYVQKYL